MARAWTAATVAGLALMACVLVPAAPAQSVPSPVAIAVLDTGIDDGHDEFDRDIERHSFVEPTVPVQPPPGLPNPFEELGKDPDGQGTAVASRVGGKTLGVHTRTAGLVDLQVSGQYGCVQPSPQVDRVCTGLDPAAEAAAAQAMDWLLQHHGGNGLAGPRIALLSFANRDLSGDGAETLATQAHGLWEAGVLVVVPKGGNSTLHASPYLLTVARVGDTAGCTGAAQLSPATTLKPDVAARGENVGVAVARSNPTDSEFAKDNRTGAEYAAAEVASLAARIWSDRPDLPVEALTAILRDTATDAGTEGADACTGFGAIQPQAAYDAAMAWKDQTPTEPLAQPSPAWPVVVPILALGAMAWRRRGVA